MTGRADLILAFGAALGLHAAALTFSQAPGGGGAGNGGQDRLSITAAPQELSALVDAWDTAPKVAHAPESPDHAVFFDKPLSPSSIAPTVRTARPPAPMTPVLPDAAPPRSLDTPGQPPVPEQVDLTMFSPSAVDTFPPRSVKPLPPPLSTTRPAIDAARPKSDPAPSRVERPKSRPTGAASPRRIAAGAGASGKRGETAVSTGSALSKAAEKAAISAWAASIERKIARHQSYPRGSRDEGRVRVAMVILADGRLGQVSIARSSGSAALDKAAVRAVQRAAPFPPAPSSLSDDWFKVGQWIAFQRR